ncbi:MAG: phospho-N-acetylmuramoyl-pentapeptide-transferase [Rickettsiaceae bacterium]|nr:phospho-N-acetylmuramoyl-pentapeptide-transferase [Rickettsiaceae bacterium]
MIMIADNILIFRCFISLFFSFFLSLILVHRIIPILRNVQQSGQPIRTLGPETHFSKAGTPTMGGVIIIFSVSLSTIIFADLSNPYIWISLFVLLSFSMLGFLDDYKKITKNNHIGITPKVKLFFQLAVSMIAILLTNHYFNSDLSTKLSIPFFKHYLLEISYLYFPFAMIVITGSSNAVNLTDGVDGLASSTIAIATLAFAIIAYIASSPFGASSLNIIYTPLTTEMTILCSAIIGSCLGFLWFNSNPAEIFMGDTSSLSLGAMLGIISIMTKQELLLVIIGGIFVIETLSVIIQVYYFKKTAGKRFFLMTPIHHHFEKKGWTESKVLVRFCIISFLLALLGLFSIIC